MEEAVAKPKKRNRRHSAELKRAAVERMRKGENVEGISRELKVRRQVLYRWKATIEQGRPLRQAGRPVQGEKEREEEAQERIAELERLVGTLTAENRFFKGALQRIKQQRQRKSDSGVTGFTSKSGSKPGSKAN